VNRPSWELVIKAGLGRDGFQLQPSLVRRTLMTQAEREGLLLITTDALVARYPGPVRHQSSV
jgi:hypothetical protein